MLYEMAKRHDDRAGEDYEGSSLRGAMRGFKEMRVCGHGGLNTPKASAVRVAAMKPVFCVLTASRSPKYFVPGGFNMRRVVFLLPQSGQLQIHPPARAALVAQWSVLM